MLTSSVSWNSSTVGLGQWWGLQELVSIDALEGSFALNFITLAAVTSQYVSQSKGNQLAVGYTSVSTCTCKKKRQQKQSQKVF